MIRHKKKFQKRGFFWGMYVCTYFQYVLEQCVFFDQTGVIFQDFIRLPAAEFLPTSGKPTPA